MIPIEAASLLISYAMLLWVIYSQWKDKKFLLGELRASEKSIADLERELRDAQREVRHSQGITDDWDEDEYWDVWDDWDDEDDWEDDE